MPVQTRLDSHLRRVSAYLYLQDLFRGTVVELQPADDPRAAERQKLLGTLRRGPGQVVGVTDLEKAPMADVLLAVEVAPEQVGRVAAAARQRLSEGGILILGCESRDRPGAQRGLSYYELVDRLEGEFPAVTMIGQAPFAGATLVEYGVKDPEPMLDGSLVDRGERVEWYLAVAGPKKISAGGYAVIQLPLAEAARAVETVSPAPPAPAPAPAKKEAPRPAPGQAELQELLRAREKGIEELRQAALEHAAEMAKKRTELAERDALIAELERDGREAAGLREAARRAEARAQAAEEAERKARLRLAESEGRLLRAGAPSPTVAAPVATAALSEAGGDLGARLAALEAENARLRQKEEEARADSWRHLKARSDAEAQAAEVREDTVRKLKDARKIANLELTRAMEEATRKAVSLKDELNRTERERKELIVEVARLKAELETRVEPEPPRPLELARAREEGDAAARAARAAAERETHDEASARAAAESAARQAQERIDALSGRVAALERELAESQAERQRLARLYAMVDEDGQKRAEAGARLRQSLREREREVETLRRELAERDGRVSALERGGPGAPEEAAQLEAELGRARLRLAELERELERREMMSERAQAAAGHERARAERLIAEERRAIGDRNEARARAAEAESRAAALSVENERLRQAQREEDEVRTRLSAVEAALHGEVERLARMEEALRRAAEAPVE